MIFPALDSSVYNASKSTSEDEYCSYDDSAYYTPTKLIQYVPPTNAGNNNLGSSYEPLELEQKYVQILKQKLNELKRQLFVTRQTSKRRLEALRKRKGQINELKKSIRQLKKQKASNEALGEQAKKIP